MNIFTNNAWENFPDSLHQQIVDAFNKKPDLDGVLHGQRHISQGSVGKRTGLFSSYKNNGMISYESQLELAHAIQLERNPSVKYYRTQALKISISHDQFLYPDFLIKYTNEEIAFHEVKPSKRFLDQEDIERYQRLKTFLAPNGISFDIVDRHELYSDAEVKVLLHYNRRSHARSWSSFEIQFALSLLTPGKLLIKKKLMSILKNNSLPLELGEFLIFHKYIKLNTQNDKQGGI
ncbi:TnsA endonuclease N-terminal domain-containing protein [Acinetobacter guillouiae]|uniref:TnsA endonuclease N-terminal domain-containing protein n=1 Tax=Acinetobacter guillouiae TaxID=106649 RepID=UPI0032B41752